MRTLTAVMLFLLVTACSSNSGGNAQSTSMPASSQATGAAALMTVVLPNSTTTFKAAQAACSGALGSVTFALNHARAHAAAGVDLHEQPSTAAGIITMVFSDSANGESATVEVNSHHRSVAGKNVTAKANKTVACVGAE